MTPYYSESRQRNGIITPMNRATSLLIFLIPTLTFAQSPNTNWPNVGNDKGGQRYSLPDQINRTNVTTLKIAWTYHTKDNAPGSTIECTPLVIDGVMYVTTVRTKVAALDAATGKPLWTHDPYADGRPRLKASGGVNRGVAFWRDGATKRVLVGLSDGRLLSLNTATGHP